MALLSLVNIGYSQCSAVPVKEAVRNGDFELGYLSGPAAKNHVSTVGSNYDFYSDMSFMGTYPAAQPTFDMADHYAIMHAENFTWNNVAYTNNNYWGVAYGGDKNFADHTTGVIGDGYALVVDLAAQTVSPKTSGLPIAWEQTMDITPNQKYWFSAWIANYHGGTPPVMQVVVIPYKVSDGLPDAPVTLGINISPAGVMQWTNMSAAWDPSGIAYNKVTIRFEFVNTAGGSTGLDVAIDDISFINTCQNVNGQNAYTADFKMADTMNLCTNSGSITLDPNVLIGQQNNATIHWYSGAGNPQTEIFPSAWSKIVTSSGSYRVCIDDPDNNCSVNDNVVVIDKLSLPQADLALCVPSFYTLDAGFNIPNGAISAISWSGPSGSSTKRTYDVTTAGIHNLNIVSAPGLNCDFSDAFNVTSTLPANIPKNLSFRECADTTLLLDMADGKQYNWSKNQNLVPLLSTGTSINVFVPNGTATDQTIWVQSADFSALPVGGPTAASFTTYSGTITPMTFTTTTPTVLNSFVVQKPLWEEGCAGAGSTISVTFTLSGTVNLSYTIPVLPCGNILTTVTPNWNLPAGSYSLSSSVKLGFCPAIGNTSIGGTAIKITNADATNNNQWNNYADMNFSALVACDPAPVKLTSLCCNKPVDNPKIDPSSVLNVCNPADAKVVFAPLTIGYDYKFIVSHNNGLSYKDTLSGTVGISGKVTLSPISGSGKYKLIFATSGNIGNNCAKIADDSAIVVVKPSPTKPVVTVSPNKTFCLGEAHTLTALSTIVGNGAITYTWSGDVVSVGAVINGLTTKPGHTYKVVVSNNGCKDSTTTTTTVIDLESAKINAAGPFCNNIAPVTLQLTGGSTLGGVWSGTNVNVASGAFSPNGLAAGSYKIKYASSNTVCAGKDSINITVNPSANYSITSTKNNYCKKGSLDTIEINTTGGTFWTKNNKGITDAVKGYYDPKLDNLGADTIYYGSGGVCGDTAVLAIVVHDSTAVTFVLPDHDICDKAAAFTLGVASLPGGSYSGPGVSAGTTFNPSTAGIGTHTILYTYSDGNACLSHVKDDITVHQLPTVSLALDTVAACFNRTSVALSGGSPIGGVYSGAGVTGNNYNPSSQSVGAKTITYTFTDNNSCVNSATATFTINALPKLALHDTSVCGTYLMDATLNATIAKPATYAWDNGAPGAATTLLVIADGNHSVKVTDKNKCVSTKTVTIDIKTPANVSLGVDTNICFTGKKNMDLHASQQLQNHRLVNR